MMNSKVIVTIALAGALIAGRTTSAQSAPSEPPAAYVNENPTDPAPLKLREVEGTVRGLGGDPMPRASVSLFNEQGHTLISTVLSDKDGKFRFNKVDKGLYRVVVRLQGLCPANVPILVESSLLARRKFVITMLAKDIDTCSYGMAK